MRPITVGIIGAAALVVGVLIVREIRAVEEAPRPREIPAGEIEPTTLSLERIRSLGY
jgi:hypothetical protein